MLELVEMIETGQKYYGRFDQENYQPDFCRNVKAAADLHVSFELNPQRVAKFEDSFSSIGCPEKSKANKFETSDFYNVKTVNVSMAQPVVNSSEYVVKHGDPLNEYQAFGDSFRAVSNRNSPNKLNRPVSQVFNSSLKKGFDTFAPNSQQKAEWSVKSNKQTSQFYAHHQRKESNQDVSYSERILSTMNQEGNDHEIRTLKSLLGTMARDLDIKVRSPLYLRNNNSKIGPEEETELKHHKPYLSPLYRKIQLSQRYDQDANKTFEMHNKPRDYPQPMFQQYSAHGQIE